MSTRVKPIFALYLRRKLPMIFNKSRRLICNSNFNFYAHVYIPPTNMVTDNSMIKLAILVSSLSLSFTSCLFFIFCHCYCSYYDLTNRDYAEELGFIHSNFGEFCSILQCLMIQTTHICICIKPDPHACHCCVDEKRVALSQHISSSSASRHCKFILYISFKSCWFSIASIVNKNFCMSLSFCLRLRHCDFYDCSHVLLHGMLHGVTYLKCLSSFFLDVVQKWF